MLSILNLHEPAGVIPDSVFSDVSLDRLFSKSDISVLSRICTADDISARQQIFKLLEDQQFYSWLHDLYLNIKYVEKSKYLFEHSAHEVEKCALFYGYACSYVNAVESMKNSVNVPLLAVLNGVPDSRSAMINMLKTSLNEYKNLWDSVSENRMSICESGVYVKPADDSAKTVGKRIFDICKRLGYIPQGDSRSSDIKIPPRLANAMVTLYTDEFRQMSRLRTDMLSMINPDILSLSEELEFYFSMNRLREKAAAKGILVCYPVISDVPMYLADDLYDITLILKDGAEIVPNDLKMSQNDSVFFIRGANGGGKTTFVRAVTANLIMFLGGCPVFAGNAKIYPFRRVFTHFPENEGFAVGGRLENEEKRLEEVVKNADCSCFMLFNETFSGADEQKGTGLAMKLMNMVSEKGAFALFVTHFHGVGEGKIPSLTTVVSGDSNVRTFKIVRQDSGRSSYAGDILKKYGLDRESLRRC